jgi:hypothetical protein
MLLAKKDQYYQIISNHENNQFFNGYTTFFQIFNSLAFTAEGGDVAFLLLLLNLVIILCAFFGFIFPFMLFFVIVCFISHNKFFLVILSSINLISFIIVNLGFWGKLHCFCLYRPHQWLFFMIIFDMINFFCNCSLFFLIIDYERPYDHDYFFYLMFGFLGGVFYSITFVVIHNKIAQKLIILFNTLRTLETNVIKFCTFEYIKELKKKSENIN